MLIEYLLDFNIYYHDIYAEIKNIKAELEGFTDQDLVEECQEITDNDGEEYTYRIFDELFQIETPKYDLPLSVQEIIKKHKKKIPLTFEERQDLEAVYILANTEMFWEE